ncbi:MAG: class I SAM-dependent methyltransferase, partial [Patescibacteria group bacterium]
IAKSGNFVVMYDVDDYRVNDAKSLPFDGDWAERYDEFDTALVITVLHHCDDPEIELASLRKVARRLVVIESVVDEQMPYSNQAVVDWIYNRGMHPGAQIPVPGQFRTTHAWHETFARHGFKVVHEEDFGIDLPVVPEHHVLFICE